MWMGEEGRYLEAGLESIMARIPFYCCCAVPGSGGALMAHCPTKKPYCETVLCNGIAAIHITLLNVANDCDF
jgi:hypothetical protein